MRILIKCTWPSSVTLVTVNYLLLTLDARDLHMFESSDSCPLGEKCSNFPKRQNSKVERTRKVGVERHTHTPSPSQTFASD